MPLNPEELQAENQQLKETIASLSKQLQQALDGNEDLRAMLQAV